MERVTGIHSAASYPGKLDDAAKNDLDELFGEVFPRYFGEAMTKGDGGQIESSWAMLVQNPGLAIRVARLSDFIVHEMPWCQRRDMRELMIQTVNVHLGCDYSFFAHFGYAQRTGIGADLQAALQFWKTTSFFNEDQRTVIEFTHASLDGDVPDELFQKVVQMFGEKETVEFTVSIAYWSFWAIILNTLRPTLNFGHTKPEAPGTS